MLAKNSFGLKNLYKIISNSEFVDDRLSCSSETLKKYKDDLLFGSCFKNGELYKAIEKGYDEDKLSQIVSNFDYLEIHRGKIFGINNGKIVGKNHQDINKKIVEIGDKKGKLVIASNKPSYLNLYDYNFMEILHSGTEYKHLDVELEQHLQSTEDLLKEQSYLGKDKAYEVVVTNSNLIADMCENITCKEEKIVPYLENSIKQLKSLSLKIAKSIYGEKLPKNIQERLDYEIYEIINNGYESVYIGLYYLLHEAKQQGFSIEVRSYDYKYSFIAFLFGITDSFLVFDTEWNDMFLGMLKSSKVSLKVTNEYIDNVNETIKKIYKDCNIYGYLNEEFVKFNDAWKFNERFQELYKDSPSVQEEELEDVVEKLEKVKLSENCIQGNLILVPKSCDITDITPIKYDKESEITALLMDNIGFEFRIY